jgi:phosphonopyruvate decarboxylase
MLNTIDFGNLLKTKGFDFYSGIPCSFLKDLINYAINEAAYVMAANEGDAVAICVGAKLGGKKPVVLMQNSGLGNAVSPLTSLNAIFQIPVLGFVSLRGEPGLKDEPQHDLMGIITDKMLETMHIDFAFLSDDEKEAAEQLENADKCINDGRTFFFIVKKDTFSKVELKHKPDAAVSPAAAASGTVRYQKTEMIRAIKVGAGNKSLYLATTGFTGRELYEIGDDPNNLYMAGSLGCVSSLGLGLSLAKPDRSVVVLDGDGSLLMRMGSLAVTAFYKPKALFHVLFDNRCHESTGGQFTVSFIVDFPALALAAGFPSVISVYNPEELKSAAEEWSKQGGLVFAYCPVSLRSSKELARPSVKPPEVAVRFIDFLQS